MRGGGLGTCGSGGGSEIPVFGDVMVTFWRMESFLSYFLVVVWPDRYICYLYNRGCLRRRNTMSRWILHWLNCLLNCIIK